jgi:hypothetical protein
MLLIIPVCRGRRCDRRNSSPNVITAAAVSGAFTAIGGHPVLSAGGRAASAVFCPGVSSETIFASE